MASLCKIESLWSDCHAPVPKKRAVDGYINNHNSNWPIIPNNTPRDWSLVTGRGTTIWESCDQKLLDPPPQDRAKLFEPPAPPLTTAKKKKVSSHGQTTSKLVPPLRMAKTFSAPIFVGVKLHLPPPMPL